MGRKVKWTHELRCLIYRAIATRFGPHKKWGTKFYPNGKSSEYENTLKIIADFLTVLTGAQHKASEIKQQINWAISEQKALIKKNYSRQYILNKAAAIESHFIEGKDLPAILAHNDR